MRRPTHSEKAAVCFLLCLVFVQSAQSQSGEPSRSRPESGAKSVRFVRAIVVDGRLSALRREPDLGSQLVQRLRVGRQVFIFGMRSGRDGRPDFYRVAVSRRTRGWLHRSAVIVPDRAGEDARVLKLADAAGNGLDRILLCRILIDRFNRSPLTPRALLLLAEEAVRASGSLSARARRRLSGVEKDDHDVRDYYLNDAGLDRYSRLGVRFDFDEEAGEYVYDGQAYREIIRRFPKSPEADVARDRLERIAAKLPKRERD